MRNELNDAGASRFNIFVTSQPSHVRFGLELMRAYCIVFANRHGEATAGKQYVYV